ncbi:hypothetical protein V8F33_012293 [Rhypophila sp. PSN 637]
MAIFHQQPNTYEEDSDVPDGGPNVSVLSKVMGKYVKSQFKNSEGKEFMPEGKLSKILTRDMVRKILRSGCDSDSDSDRERSDPEPEEGGPELEDLVDFVVPKAIKVFTITLLIDIRGQKLHKALDLFRRHNFSDNNLPIQHIHGSGTKKESADQHEFKRMKLGWRTLKIRDFYDKQWTFLAWVIEAATSERGSSKDLEHPHIVPFTEKIGIGCDRGGFGQVSHYRVHPKHLDDPEQPVPATSGYRDLAVKELLPRSEDDRKNMIINWEREAGVLQKMNALRQENIVRFLTAFRRGDKGKEDYYLVFDWADGGNLRTLWKTLKRPKSFLMPQLVKDAVKQILGLATALNAAHNPESGPKFRHGDLKPENILWFDSKDRTSIGTLKIADWGLAKEHTIETELRSNNTSTDYGTRRYESPEEFTREGIGLTPDPGTGKQKKKRSRLYDVWAMGCITLEFIVWLVYGLEGLKQFNSEIRGNSDTEHPPFYQAKTEGKKRKATVHPAVVKWMEKMASLPVCQPGSTALGSLLELVQTRLLVIDLPVGLGGTQGASPDLGPVRSNDESPSASRASIVSLTLDQTSPARLGQTSEDANGINIPQIIISDADGDSGGARQPMTPPPSPPRTFSKPSKPSKGRARSIELVERMTEIYLDHDDDRYWYNGTDTPDPTPTVADNESLASPLFQFETSNGYRTDDSTGSIGSLTDNTGGKGLRSNPTMKPKNEDPLLTGSGKSGRLGPTTQRIDYGSSKLDSDWDINIDNSFATELFATLKQMSDIQLPGEVPSWKLCESCRSLRDHIWDAAFDKTYAMSLLQQNTASGECDLCSLFWHTCQKHEITDSKYALVKRVGSSLVVNGTSTASLSIIRTPDLTTRTDETIQIGFGILPEPTSAAHFQVLRQWLAHCDSNKNHKHSSCRPPVTEEPFLTTNGQLPTRVLDVGLGHSPSSPRQGKVYLRHSRPQEQGKWLALSYQWGPTPHFCTTVDNLSRHLTEGMEVANLPATFRDAIIVTRSLGIRYLWIDSLCIIQGEGGDFAQEAKKMEQVYSGAYCVVAVARQDRGQTGGFLDQRRNRNGVVLASSSNSSQPLPCFYITEPVDNFQEHVLDSGLSNRGWVLQEHALARRTIFFTDHQTYFECGEGVRCESGVRMWNSLSTLLGDPNFPEIIMTAAQGEKIQRYQDLYRRYSRLELTNAYDRPTAIGGLQDRLLKALNVKGGFGVFDQGQKKKGLLRRSLLWVRCTSPLPCSTCGDVDMALDSDESGTLGSRHAAPGDGLASLEKIDFTSQRVPSWSWMAVRGAIDYVSPDFNGVEWEEMESPWSGGLVSVTTGAGGGTLLTLAVNGPLSKTPGSGASGTYKANIKEGDISLVAVAWEYTIPYPQTDVAEPRNDSDYTIRASTTGITKAGGDDSEPDILAVFDRPSRQIGSVSLCVVLGKAKNVRDRRLQRHYVIFVKATEGTMAASADNTTTRKEKIYKRIGAGYLPGRCINWDKAGLKVTIH